jgi:transposase
MNFYIGLDMFQRKTAICVVNENGKIVAEGNSLTLPSDIHSWLTGKDLDPTAVHGICLEAGAMSSFIYEALGLPVVCVEAFQAHQFLKAQRNKTDKNDARGLAQYIRMGGDYIRSVRITVTAGLRHVNASDVLAPG